MATESFESRVHELVRDGKLTADEAAELLRDAGRAPVAPPSVPTIAAVDAPPRLFIELTAGSVSIRGRPDVCEPRLVQADRSMQLRATPSGWVLEHRPVVDLSGALAWFRASVAMMECGDVELEVPESFTELEVRALSGDIAVRDVRGVVRVTLTAGDVDLDRVGGFDVTARTGRVRVRALVTGGTHRIHANTGSAELMLDAGSSADLELSTVLGRVDAPRVELSSGGVLGRKHRGRVGAGAGRIRVETVTGDIDVRAATEA